MSCADPPGHTAGDQFTQHCVQPASATSHSMRRISSRSWAISSSRGVTWALAQSCRSVAAWTRSRPAKARCR
jgi:hypothetical protein